MTLAIVLLQIQYYCIVVIGTGRLYCFVKLLEVPPLVGPLLSWLICGVAGASTIKIPEHNHLVRTVGTAGIISPSPCPDPISAAGSCG